MKKQNRYDLFIDDLSQRFSQIKNFELLQEDEKGKKLFNFIVKRLAEIHSFKTLFSHYYLPSASKSVVDDLNEIQKSKYKHLLIISREDLKENYYETIRLGYIGMFHKYENYIDDLITHSELLISVDEEIKMSLTKYIEKEFNFKIKDWKNSPTIDRLNWVSICNKHYDGYPRKEPIPAYCIYHDFQPNEKMKFTKEDFIRDIDSLIIKYNLLLQLVFSFAIYKMTFETMNWEINEFTNLESHQKLIEAKKLLYNQIMNLIDLNNRF